MSSLAQDKTLGPGESFEGSILLRNTDNQNAEVTIYQKDYLFFSDGRSIYSDPGTVPRSNAAWITLNPTHVTVQAGSTVSVSYKVKVPDRRDLAGSYWSMVMVETLSVQSPGIRGDAEKVEVGVKTRVRFGIQIATEIGGATNSSLRINNKNLQSKEGKTTLLLDVENTGDSKLVPALWMELYDTQGVSAGRFEGGKWRIYPGCSVRYSVDVSSVRKGKYVALVVLDSGDDHVIGAQYALEILP